MKFVMEHGSINVSEALRLADVKTWHTAKKSLLELVDMEILEYIRRSDLERDSKARFILKGSVNEA